MRVVADSGRYLTDKNGRLQLDEGIYELPDGTLLHVDARGNFRIDDSKARVVYQATRIREFNPYVNAADLLAGFIRYVGRLGVSAQEVAQLPISLLVNWLVLEAAEKDGDPVPVGVLPLPADPQLRRIRHPRCRQCQKYIPRRHADAGVLICGPGCLTRLLPTLSFLEQAAHAH